MTEESKVKKLIKEIEELTTLELAELVKALQDKFGVTAPAAVAPTAAPAATEKPAEEKSIFNILLKEVGPKKIEVIKVVKEITKAGLKEAKDIVEAAPKVIKEGVKKEEAEEIKKKLEQVGAKVELQ